LTRNLTGHLRLSSGREKDDEPGVILVGARKNRQLRVSMIGSGPACGR
jgi:hypothetical protein